MANRIDIALDPAPYNGTTTTCEALWMGVPVLTLAASQTHAGRVGVTLLRHVGVPGLIASNEADYVRIATELAANMPRLAEYLPHPPVRRIEPPPAPVRPRAARRAAPAKPSAPCGVTTAPIRPSRSPSADTASSTSPSTTALLRKCACHPARHQ